MDENNKGACMGEKIYDDVFKTLLNKCTSFIIPVINEIFGTSYSMDDETLRLDKELIDDINKGTVYADAVIRIQNAIYHLECQSTKDGKMIIRMLEYDFRLALNSMQPSDDGEMVMYIPKSAVIYLRDEEKHRKRLRIRVVFPDGTDAHYEIPTLYIDDYSKEDIFSKELLFFIPYFIMRYIDELEKKEPDMEILLQMEHDFQDIFYKLACTGVDVDRSRIMNLTQDIVYYINERTKSKSASRSLQEVIDMGGKVLTLECDLREEKGRDEGLREGRKKERDEVVRNMILKYRDGSYTLDFLLAAAEMVGNTEAVEAELKRMGLTEC